MSSERATTESAGVVADTNVAASTSASSSSAACSTLTKEEARKLRPGDEHYRDIFDWLSSAKQDPDAEQTYAPYRRIPGVPRVVWDNLGDQIKERETAPVMRAKRTEWIVLRLDIRNMTGLKKRFGANGKEPCENIAHAMRQAAISVTRMWGALLAYTQSDEITVVLHPRAHDTYQHPFDGTRDKLVSLSAAEASQAFMIAMGHAERLPEVTQIIQQRGLPSPFPAECDVVDEYFVYPINYPFVSFDCRMSCWNSLREALGVIAWRAEDCARNGVSDAALCITKKLQGKSVDDRLKLVLESGRYEEVLPSSRAYGTLVRRVQRVVRSVNPKTGTEENTIRTELHCPPLEEHVFRQLLDMVKDK